jgi:hypothetical protein
MSADRQTLLYHLVSSGTPHWIATEDDAPVPEDRLLSFELEIYQGSPFGRESRHWKQVGKRASLTDIQVSELIATYPKPQRTMELSTEALARLLNR